MPTPGHLTEPHIQQYGHPSPNGWPYWVLPVPSPNGTGKSLAAKCPHDTLRRHMVSDPPRARGGGSDTFSARGSPHLTRMLRSAKPERRLAVDTPSLTAMVLGEGHVDLGVGGPRLARAVLLAE